MVSAISFQQGTNLPGENVAFVSLVLMIAAQAVVRANAAPHGPARFVRIDFRFSAPSLTMFEITNFYQVLRSFFERKYFCSRTLRYDNIVFSHFAKLL